MQKRYKAALALIGVAWLTVGAHLLAYATIPAWMTTVDSAVQTMQQSVARYSNSTVTLELIGVATMALLALLLSLFLLGVLRKQRKPHIAATLNTVTVTDDVLRQMWVAKMDRPFVTGAHADVVSTGRKQEAWLLTVEVSAQVGTDAYLEVEQYAQEVATDLQEQIGLEAPVIIRLHKSRTQQPSVI